MDLHCISKDGEGGLGLARTRSAALLDQANPSPSPLYLETQDKSIQSWTDSNEHQKNTHIQINFKQYL